MFIFRVEAERYGFVQRTAGIYQTSLITDMAEECSRGWINTCLSGASTPNRPSPMFDSGFSDDHLEKVGHDDILFGFESMESLISWFNYMDWCDSCTELFADDATICIYEVEDAFIFPGGRQLIFDRNMATCVRRMSPEEALDCLPSLV